MLRPVPLVPVREQERQARRLAPLRERRRDELVDHDLGPVCEVAVLRLPEDERLGRGGRVAVLETETRILGERRVEHLEGRVRFVEMLHRRERLSGVHVVEHEVALGKRAALRILAGQPHGDPVDEQRGVGERFSLTPVDATFGDRSAAPLELARELRVNGEVVGRAQQLVVQLDQPVGRDSGRDLGCRRTRDLTVRIDLRSACQRGTQTLVRRAKRHFDLCDELVGFLRREDSLGDQLLLVELAHARMRVDLLDHQRLGVGRFVLLVVTEPAVADEVDHDVLSEPLPVRQREPDGCDRRLGVVGVDVHDRHVEALGQVGGVARRPALVRVGREADLVVRDQMDGAARRVALEIVQVQRFRDDPLPGERRIPVEQDGQRDRRIMCAVSGRAIGLLGSCSPLDDRIDRFEMARIRHQAHADLAVLRLARAMRGEVVLDVAGAAFRVGGDGVDRPLAFELAQDVLVGHPDRVREHVQAATVGHPHHDLVSARLRRELDRLVEHRDHHVETLE